MDVVALLDEYGVEGNLNGEEYLCLCPFHNDSNPSCSINIEKGVYKCFVCDAKGDIYAFLAGVSGTSRATIKKHVEGALPHKGGINETVLLKWNEKLLKAPEWLEILETKGVTLQEIEEHLLGYDGQRITIPVYSAQGKVINIRRYLPNAKKNKWLNKKGCGGTHLYPIEVLNKNDIVITEGEIKAILLNSVGIPAICQSSGAKGWTADLNPKFKDKNVYILYDIDKAGNLGAEKVAVNLYKFAAKIKLIQLPIDPRQFPNGDITNFIVDLGKTKEDILELMEKADLWEPEFRETRLDSEIFDTHLSRATEAKFCGKVIKAKVVVTAKDTVPYVIPKQFKVSCTKDKDYCAFCNVYNYESEYELDNTDPVILDMVGVTTAKLSIGLKKIAGIPAPCNVCKFETQKSINVEELRLMPKLEITTESTEHVVRQGYYIGHGIETNTSYDIKARMCPRPDTQYATLIAFEAETVIDDLATFSLEDPDDLKIFQPEKWTVDGLRSHLSDLYGDLSSNVTRIYKRNNLHLFYDLVYHSALYITFQGQTIKGWTEGLVIGDSGQGKSETISKLQKHYGLGEKIDVKCSTAVGLVGGLQETSKRWFVSWGIIPLNDKRLVVLEEVKGMPEEVISKLTEVRSSGIAEISKVEKAKTNSRTRLIWVSNPRSDRQVLSYNYGVETVKELIGNLEDIRRFDFAIILSSGDVDRKWVNISDRNRPKHEHRFTSSRCQQLILWGWSRDGKQVKFESGAVDLILQFSEKMGEKYSSQIPLVESADQRLKLARLSTSLAIRTFSTENGESVVVRKCHVRFIHEYLSELYDSATFGYKDYSDSLKYETEVRDKEELVEKIKKMPHARDVVRQMLDTVTISAFDLADMTGYDMDRCRELVGVLVRKNAIKRKKRFYEKTPSFIAVLKELQITGELDNETAFAQTSTEDF